MIDLATEATVRVEVWLRDGSPPPGDPRQTVVGRLRDLAANGRIDELSVRGWTPWIAAETGGDALDGSPARARLERFRAWAERTEHSLAPAFVRCERSSLVSTAQTTAIRPPLQCLAVYADDRLVGVFPCSTDGETRTVKDCLRALEASRRSAEE